MGKHPIIHKPSQEAQARILFPYEEIPVHHTDKGYNDHDSFLLEFTTQLQIQGLERGKEGGPTY